MIGKCVWTLGIILSVSGMAISAQAQSSAQPAESQPGNAGTASRSIGTVKSISEKALVLKTDAGAEVTVTLTDGARIMRLAPGQTDLKSATPMTLPEVQVGDRTHDDPFFG